VGAVPEVNFAGGAVDAGSMGAEQQLHLLVFIPGRRLEIEALFVEFALHVGFRQRGALVGQGGLVADERQVAGIAALAERLHGLRGRLAGADDDNVLRLSQRHSGSPGSFVTAASLLCLFGCARRCNHARTGHTVTGFRALRQPARRLRCAPDAHT
jgi:hypothetical protein